MLSDAPGLISKVAAQYRAELKTDHSLMDLIFFYEGANVCLHLVLQYVIF